MVRLDFTRFIMCGGKDLLLFKANFGIEASAAWVTPLTKVSLARLASTRFSGSNLPILLSSYTPNLTQFACDRLKRSILSSLC